MSENDDIKYLGIDLGTSSIVISYYDQTQNTIVTQPISGSEINYPVFYGVNRRGVETFGEDAKLKMANSAYTICSGFKRFIGKSTS